MDTSITLLLSSCCMFLFMFPLFASGTKIISAGNVTDFTHEYDTVSETGDVYLGGRAHFDVWQPYVERSTEFSSSQLWVIARAGSTTNTIEAGWHVYPYLYGDSRTRFFIYYTNDTYKPGSGCYNLLCHGFVQTDNRIKIGEPIEHVSSYNENQYSIAIEIYKDTFNHDWWLRVSGVTVGYWPNSLLPLLSDGANEIKWGGEVVNAKIDGQHSATGMGSGQFPEEGLKSLCYIREHGGY